MGRVQSGTRSGPHWQGCAQTLIVPRLRPLTPGGGPDGRGRPLHFVFCPVIAPERTPLLYSTGGTDRATDRPEFEINLAPCWLPLAGELHVEGGRVGPEYELTVEFVPCLPPPSAGEPSGPIMTLRALGAPAPLPRGTTAVRSPTAVAATFDFNGDNQVLTLPAGLWVALGCLSFGTVAGPAWLDCLIGL